MKFLMFVLFACLTATALTRRKCSGIQDYYWRDHTFKWTPRDAIKASKGVYVGQVYYKENILPASVYKKKAIAEWNGKRVITEHIKILCGSDPNRFYWEKVDYQNLDGTVNTYMIDAVPGGYQEGISGTTIYIGRVFHENEWKVGKILPKERATSGLQVWDKNGNVAILQNFEILKYKSRCMYVTAKVYKHSYLYSQNNFSRMRSNC